MKKRLLICKKTRIILLKVTFSQLILWLFFVGVSFAHDGYSQDVLNKRISIKADVQPMKKVMNEIEKSADVRFLYKSNLIKADKLVSINMDNSTLDDVLKYLLTPFQLNFKVIGKQIVLKKIEVKIGLIENENIPASVPILDKPLKGSIIDDKSEIVVGASIIVKGTTKGTTSDVNGNFNLSVPNESSSIIISSVGYESQEVLIGNKTIIDIILKTDLKQLDEVVIVGYGELKKKDLTGALSSIQSRDIVRGNPTLAAKALQGQVAGATITKSDNRPGSTFNITIRGENTINNSTAPLVVIDGLMGGDLNNLNPNDIQSMDVLKDASSTAIYGARGANGVIIVTTKKGISGKPRISYDAYVGIKNPAHIPQMLSSEQFYKIAYTDRILEGVTGATFTSAEAANIKNGETTDWVGLVTKPGTQMSHNISVSGGTEKTTYRFSGGYLQEDGNVNSTNYKRYNLNAGLDSKLGEHFKAGFTSYLTYSNQNLGSQESLRGAYRARPTGVPYFADLANPSENQDINYNGLAVWMGINDKQVPNPLIDTDPSVSKLQTTIANILGNIYVEYSPIKGLSIRTSLSANYGGVRIGDYRGQWSKSQIGNKPRTQYENRTTGSYTLDNIINYNLDLGKHKITLTGLQSAFYQRNEAYIIAVKDLPYESDWYALNTGTLTNFGSSLIESSISSYMGRINYALNDKYLLTITGRSDGASQLAAGNKWAFFPSVALAWRMSDESFMRNLKSLSNLKLRVSYGEVGNATVSPYSTQAGLLNTGYDFDGTAAYGFAPQNLGNKNLRWERSKELNLGLDFGFFKNRITGTVEVYDRKTVDLILNQKIPTASGFSQVISNVGKIQNTGVEILLNTVNVTGRDFSWNTTLTFTKNDNKLLELYGEGQTIDKGNKLFVGYPIRSNFDYKFDGIWQNADKDLALKYKQVPGSVRVVDVNNDGQISSTEGIDDRMILGTQLPKFLMGITNRFKYKNVDFSFFAYYRNGTEYKNNTLSGTFGDIGTRYNSLASLDYWRSDNPSNTYFGVAAANPYRSAITYQDATFLRISDVTFGYTIPKGKMDKNKLSNARIYTQVINPFIFTKYTGFDPEFNSAIYQDDVPSMTISLGVNVSF
jgi:TonB-linked SusC/RagA family outer membrane protein